MNLCIDIGNTAVKYGLFKGEVLEKQGEGAEALFALKQSDISHTIVSSVVDKHPVLSWLKKENIPFVTLSHSIKLPFSLVYKTPETIGADRLAAIAGAMKHYPGQNNLVIIAGSCITYNAIVTSSHFVGGAISPGLQMRLKAMNHFTAKLPLIEFTEDKYGLYWIGGDTESCLISGAANGVLAEIDGFITQYKKEFTNLNTLICGGDAPFLVSHLKNNIFAHPTLILEGLNYILQLNAN